VRLPSQLLSLEFRVQELVKAALSRGRVNGTITMERSAGNGQQMVSVDMDLAAAYVNELRKAGEQLGLADGLRTDLLLRVPGLVTIDQKVGTEEVLPVLELAVNAALDKLQVMREQEGKELADDLSARLLTLESGMAEIGTYSESVTEAYRAKLFARLEQAGLENLAEDERMIKEIALFADRCDITEEQTRLKSHIAQFRKFLCADEPVGRSLDFLSQELFREINTIGSKANDVEITRCVVAFKTELERIREQVQNVE
jgi:uncharacterized protein (TIGR00255 family)